MSSERLLEQWPDGATFEGDINNGVINGSGKYTWPDGSVYEGDVVNGLRHGQGHFICKNKKTTYTGEWRSGKRHGKGKMVYNIDNPYYYYEGDWMDNNKNGFGKMQYSSGNIYEGEWKDNKQHGVGTMHWFARGEVYTGEWINGFQHGAGTHLWTFKSSDSSQYPLRNWYEGEWVKGHREGHGIFYYSTGCSYEGDWRKDKKHGKGHFTSKNESKFQCYFVDDKIQSTSEESLAHKIIGGNTDRLDKDIDHMLTVKEFSCISVSDKIETLESNHVQTLLLRDVSELRLSYIFYCSLGTKIISDRVSVMSGLQLSAFLRDSNIHQYGWTIFDVECLFGDDSDSFESLHDPERHIVMNDFNKIVLFLATRSRKSPSDKLESLMKSVFASSTNVHGILFFGRPELTAEFLRFRDKLWKTYLLINKISKSAVVKFRDIWTLFKALTFPFYENLKKSGLLDSDVYGKVSSSEVLELIIEGDLNCLNLEVKLSFLEFMEVVLKFIAVTVPLHTSSSLTLWHQHLQQVCDDLWTMADRTELKQ